MNVQPYLYFGGRSEEAIEFYKSALGAKVETVMHFKDMPGDKSMIPAGGEGKVMHACIKIGDSAIFLSDGNCDGKATFSGVTLTIAQGTFRAHGRYGPGAVNAAAEAKHIVLQDLPAPGLPEGLLNATLALSGTPTAPAATLDASGTVSPAAFAVAVTV